MPQAAPPLRMRRSCSCTGFPCRLARGAWVSTQLSREDAPCSRPGEPAYGDAAFCASDGPALRAHPHELVTEDIQADLVVVGGAPARFVPRARARHTQRDPTRPVRRSRDTTRARNTPISIRAQAVIDRLGGGHTTASRPGDRGPGQHPASGYSRTEKRHGPYCRRQRGFRQELFLYRSAVDLLEFVVPLARGGVAAEEPTLPFSAPTPHRPCCTTWGHLLTSPSSRRWNSRADPPSTSHRRLDAAQLRPGGSPGAGDRLSQWPEWRRLEAVLNLALRHCDTWAVCAYDQRTLTANMVEDLYATHPLIGQDGHHRRNDRYRHPVNFLVQNSDDPPDPIERTPPAVELVDPSPATARAAVKWFAHERLPSQEIDKLIYATHEAVTNALQHGSPPTVLRLWAQPGRVTVTVTDAGPGPTDPLVGPLSTEPPTDSADDPFAGPALGLWFIYQLVDVSRRSEPSGYTIRLTVTHPDNHAG